MYRDCDGQPFDTCKADVLNYGAIPTIRHNVESTVPRENSVSTHLRQYMLAVSVALLGFSSGQVVGYSAILLPQLQSDGAEFEISKAEATWIASVAPLLMMLGCTLGGFLIDRFGRKPPFIVISIVFSIGWGIFSFAAGISGLYMGRFFTGFATGFAIPLGQVYLAETSDPKIRGILLSLSTVFGTLGILLTHLIGMFLHWKTTAAISSIPPIGAIVLVLFCPESPFWLLSHRTTKEATKSYMAYHGTSAESKKDWEAITNECFGLESNNNVAYDLAIVRQGSFWKPLFVLMVFFLVQQFSGINVLTFYCVRIIKHVIPEVNEYMATIAIDTVRFGMAIMSVFLLKRFGRKQLAHIGIIGTAASLFTLSIYIKLADPGSIVNTVKNDTVADTIDTVYLKLADPVSIVNTLNDTVADTAETVYLKLTNPVAFSIIDIIPLGSLLLYICFVSIGLLAIPWILTGELFSKELRGLGSGIASSFGYICFFVAVETAPYMLINIGEAETFSFYGCVCVIGAIVLMLFLPETKDKTLLEIEAFYKNEMKYSTILRNKP